MAPQADEKSRARRRLLVLTAVLLGGAVAVWRFTPLGQAASPERLAEWIGRFDDTLWAPPVVIAIYVAGGLVAFPLTLLIAATAVVFAPAAAFGLSLAGALANAAAVYLVGRKLARRTVEQAFGPAVRRVNAALEDRGVIAIAILRTVPIAPYTVVNLAAGTIAVPFRDYLLGTALGLLPGIVVLTAFGAQLREVWEQPTLGNVALIAGIVLLWLGLSLLLQRASSRWRARQHER